MCKQTITNAACNHFYVNKYTRIVLFCNHFMLFHGSGRTGCASTGYSILVKDVDATCSKIPNTRQPLRGLLRKSGQLLRVKQSRLKNTLDR